MKYLLAVFYVEVLVNILSGVAAVVAPRTLTTQFTATAIPPAIEELARWYGILVLVLAYLLWRALRLRGGVLKVVLEALLVGDVLQLIAVVMTVQTLGGWSRITALTMGLSLVYGAARMLCLWRPARTGIDAPVRAPRL